MAWRSDVDPGPPPEDGGSPPISFVSITELSPPDWTDELVGTMLSSLDNGVPEARAVIAEARQRWMAGDKDRFGAWLEAVLDPFLVPDDEEVEPAFEDECDCGAEIEVPGPWVGRGVFECERCQRRWGVEVRADESAVIWPI